MSLRTYLFGILVSTVLSWIAWFLVLQNTNPGEGVVALAAFYGSLFFGLVGTLTLIGYYGRVLASRGEVIYANIGVSFRQAVLIAFAVVALLILQSFRLLTWWDGGLLVVAIMLLELYFRAK